MFKKLAIFILWCACPAVSGVAQTANLETILDEAQKQTDVYKETFRNLLADETKIFEEFDKNGKSDKKIVVKSVILIYQSGKDAKRTAELRNVVEVNGKKVADGQKRSDELFAELAKAETLESELKKIEKESLRYDKTYIINGLTLNEGLVLNPKWRPAFEYKLTGAENLPENNYYVVSYRQTKSSPFVIINGKEAKSDDLYLSVQIDIPKIVKKEDLILSGKLWIDSKTFQILREERNIVNKADESQIINSATLEYKPGEYGIYIPKSFVMTFYDAKKQKETGKFVLIKDAVVSFDYSNFRKTETDVIVLDN